MSAFTLLYVCIIFVLRLGKKIYNEKVEKVSG